MNNQPNKNQRYRQRRATRKQVVNQVVQAVEQQSFRRNTKVNNVEQVAADTAAKVVQKIVNGNPSAPKGLNARRKNNNVKNRNGKITRFGQLLRSGGSMLGGYFGSAQIGEQLGAGVSRIFGQGDYVVKENSLVNGGPPAFAALNTGIRMSHREYIADITSTIAFGNTTYQITPTNSTLFPWLSSIATNFEEYQFRGLVFYFNTTCGSAISSTNNALGVVGLTTVYDPTDADLGSKREAEDYGGCVSGVPSCSLLHPVECKPNSNVLDRLYVQANNVITNPEDWKFYSHGKLNVFTQGMQQAGVNIGELWVSYDIEFFNPKILPVGTVGAAAGKVSANGQVTNQTNPFSTSVLSTTSGNIPITISGKNVTIAAGTAPGYYLMTYTSSLDAGQFVMTVTSGSSNVTMVNALQGNASSYVNTPNASAANVWHGIDAVFYKSDSNAGTIIFTPSSVTTFPASSNVDLYVVKLPNTIQGGLSLLSQQEIQYKKIIEDLIEKKYHDLQLFIKGDDIYDYNVGLPGTSHLKPVIEQPNEENKTFSELISGTSHLKPLYEEEIPELVAQKPPLSAFTSLKDFDQTQASALREAFEKMFTSEAFIDKISFKLADILDDDEIERFKQKHGVSESDSTERVA